MTQIFDNGTVVLDVLHQHGFEAYFVGGCVRDYLLNREIKDVDITTNARPEDVASIFDKTIDVGMIHGTTIVVVNHEAIEVTTYRSETTYTDHRRPDAVRYSERLNEDLERRDFTINAMVMDKQFNIIDPNDGQSDLKKRIIRTVGEPSARFSEDALRMLRALRFSTQLTFTIDEATLSAIVNHAHTIKHVSIERIMVELKKMYDSENINQHKALIVESTLFNYVPVFKHMNTELFVKLDTNNINALIATQAFFKHIELNQLSALRLSNREISDIKSIYRLLDTHSAYREARLLSYHHSIDHLESVKFLVHNNPHIFTDMDISIIQAAIDVYPQLPIKSVRDLNINGRDIMAISNQTAGVWLREVIDELVHLVLFGHIENTYDALSEWVKRHVKK